MTDLHVSRRAVLQTAASGFGYLAFCGLSTWAAEKAAGPLAAKKPHFTPRAKRVIFLCMEGGPSHVDTFDYKPRLAKDGGKPIGKGRAALARLLPSPWKFKQHGQSGPWISELFPELGKHADKLCIVNSMHTDIPAHPQAFQQMHTGVIQFRRPSMGAWVLYGLGTDNERLPGFITISPPIAGGGAANYGSAFLPAVYQGTRIGFNRQPITRAVVGNLKNPRQSTTAQRTQLDLIQAMNRATLERDRVNPGVEGIIESYELAFRMQGELPHVMDLGKETDATKKLYGIDEDETDNFGRQCLMARRMVEAGVRFVEVCHGTWDHHRNLKQELTRSATAIDRPIAGLLEDLKGRGLLKDTLVLWGGEFGRTPYAQLNDGRDHNNKGFTMWLAGGGVKGGMTYGKTDDYGYEAVADKVHIHDWHATILHLLGLDHEKLTYRYAGRDFRLTDVKGNVVKGIIA
jgi:hypothetical protein